MNCLFSSLWATAIWHCGFQNDQKVISCAGNEESKKWEGYMEFFLSLPPFFKWISYKCVSMFLFQTTSKHSQNLFFKNWNVDKMCMLKDKIQKDDGMKLSVKRTERKKGIQNWIHLICFNQMRWTCLSKSFNSVQ